MASPAPANTPNQYAYEYVIGNTNYYNKNNKYSPLPSWNNDIPSIEQTLIPKNNRFVKYMQKFLKQFELIKDQVKEFSELEIQSKVESSLSDLLSLNADAMSVEFTSDQTLFFTIKKMDYSFYIDQYLDNDVNEDSEFVMTVYKKNEILSNKSGNLHSLIISINNQIFPN